MGSNKHNQEGFGAVETLLIVLVLILVGVIGWLVYKDHNKTTTATVASTAKTPTSPTKSTTPNPYAGWKTDSTSITGLSFQYPSTWSVTPSQPTCTGAVIVSITPPSSEISPALTAAQYYLEVDKYGTQSSSCAPDGTDFSNMQFSSIQSSDQIKNGLFANDWLSFFSGSNTQFYPSDLDNAIVTSTSYDGSQKSFSGPGTVTASGNTYQAGIVTATANGQVEAPVNVTVSSFKNTQLYKDSLNILNSVH